MVCIHGVVHSIPIFLIDPEEEMIGIFMTQLRPYGQILKSKFRVLEYQAIVD